ncbi:MAG: cyclic lactone autoinducer peptide [Clostridiaceae bacterium]|nr:cyclic lactone autoinducer peptide [Clostridiaceae bacterium]
MKKVPFWSKGMSVLASLVLMVSVFSVKTACFMFFHQPKVPDKLRQKRVTL